MSNVSLINAKVIVLYNPVCGDRTAKQFIEGHVLPRLESGGIKPTTVVASEGVDHAGTIVIDFLREHKGELVVVLGSGDGTLHEIINALTSFNATCTIPIVLVPCGTANALYSSFFHPVSGMDPIAYKLLSLDAFITCSKSKPLTLAYTTLVGNMQEQIHRRVVSAVVTSTALHASILEDSETLRKDIPGIERYQIAAQMNITRWYRSHVKLMPISSTGAVHIYDPDKNDFVSNDGPLDLAGPFAYFLSTVNVDRLEPAFRITPLISKHPAQNASLDVVVIRPERDPTHQVDTYATRDAFAKKAAIVLTAAYQDGHHVYLRYGQNGDIGDYNSGPTVVEYFRCGGWEWIPVSTSALLHLRCA
ncbi:hypothetical protein ID866_6837 [Astraeus odoratus]|nr:hypothetical protein ID866_6837 [Astraeus odoratus]